jgi:UDP-N-acetylmuramyl pentapeptide phosphotransferase/UDP-N-acetylglucosamine-1-phosphate transferase
MLYITPVVAILVSAVLVRVLMLTGLVVDRPNERSLHIRPTPRSGGVGVVAAIVLGLSLAGFPPPVIWIALALGLLSHIDDRWNLPAPLRLFAHLFAAFVFVIGLGPWPLPWAVPLLVLGLVWMTNLYNFMDGADGLAGGMAVFGFGAYAIAAGLQGHTQLMMLALCIAAAAAGFLIFNFPPAKIFMGDVGSIPLGFLAGAFGVAGWQQGLWPLWFPLVVFAPFIVDASMTLARRMLRGELVWEAHRQHYYQRLILSGWSHRRTALSEYGLMLLCSAAALTGLRQPPAGQFALIFALALTIAAAMWAIDRRWKRFSAEAHG